MKHFQIGTGWRLGWHEELNRGLVGSDTWAFELTRQELADFCRLALQLQQTMEDMAEELSDQEAIVCSLTTELIYVQGEGFPHAFSLYLQLLTDRPVEGKWTVEAVPELMLAIYHVNRLLSME